MSGLTIPPQILHLLDSKVPDNYIERELTINDEKIKAYQIDNSKKNVIKKFILHIKLWMEVYIKKKEFMN